MSYRLGGVKMGIWLTGKLGCAWVVHGMCMGGAWCDDVVWGWNILPCKVFLLPVLESAYPWWDPR